MISRFHFFIVIGVLVAGLLLSIAMYPQLPARVPTHWNIRGQVDAYGPAWVDAAILPATSWIVLTLMLLAPRIGPFRENFSRFARIYGSICITIALMLLAIHVVVLLVASGRPVPMERALPVIAGLMIAILGNWMGKIRRNAYIGIRTPWTLASDDIWERTHRVGGRLMVVLGLAMILCGLLAPLLISLSVIFGGAIGLLIWAMIYSHRLYRHLDLE